MTDVASGGVLLAVPAKSWRTYVEYLRVSPGLRQRFRDRNGNTRIILAVSHKQYADLVHRYARAHLCRLTLFGRGSI